MSDLPEVEERGHQVLSSSFEARSIGPFFSTWPLGFIGGAAGKKTRWAAWTPPVRQKSSTLSAARSGEPFTTKAETTIPYCASGKPTTAISWTPGQR
jgi:hypothetical protein